MAVIRAPYIDSAPYNVESLRSTLSGSINGLTLGFTALCAPLKTVAFDFLVFTVYSILRASFSEKRQIE